jgi:predicted Zn-dependent peptidase
MEKERHVISEEINYSLDTPDSLAQILANQLQWPNHPLGRDIAGTQQSVAGFSRESLLAYMLAHYHPGAALLGLAGAVDHQQAVAWAEANLLGWEPGLPLQWEPAPLDHQGPSLHVHFKDTEQTHLCFSFTGLSRSDPDRFTLRLMNVVLGEGMQCRLFQEVRERLALAYSVESYASTLQDTGAFGVYAGVGAERAGEAIRAILGELDRLRQTLVPEEELRRALEFVRGRLALSMEDSFTQAAWYARQQLQGPEVAVARLEAVQPADIQRLAQALFQETRLNLAIVGPFSQDGEHFEQAIRF